MDVIRRATPGEAAAAVLGWLGSLADDEDADAVLAGLQARGYEVVWAYRYPLGYADPGGPEVVLILDGRDASGDFWPVVDDVLEVGDE